MNGIHFYPICVHLKIKNVKSYYFPVYVTSLIIIVATFIVQLIILTLELFFSSFTDVIWAGLMFAT
jgi:hypothetical protein